MREKSLNMPKSVLLMVGAVAGAGLVALANTLKQAGWTGLVLMLVILSCSGYCASLLGRCWTIVQERYPEARTKVYRPYAMIGEKAVSAWMGILVSVTVDISSVLIGVVLLVLVSDNLESLFGSTSLAMSKCLWLIVLCVLIAPLSWLDTPKDFWCAGTIATSTTGIAFVLVLIALFKQLIDGQKGQPEVNPTFKGLSLAIGTILGAAGSSCFPTIQHDMLKPEQFSRTALYAYLVIMLYFVPTSVLAYYIHGQNLGDSVLTALPHGGLRMGAEVAISAHCLFSCIISINPAMQSLEGLIGVGDQSASWKKYLLRSSVFVVVLFVGETVPRFGPLFSVLGGLTCSLMILVWPALFYLCLTSQQGDWPDRTISLHIKVLCIEIIAVGALMGVMATVSALQEIVSPNTFEAPCYLPTRRPENT